MNKINKKINLYGKEVVQYHVIYKSRRLHRPHFLKGLMKFYKGKQKLQPNNGPYNFNEPLVFKLAYRST